MLQEKTVEKLSSPRFPTVDASFSVSPVASMIRSNPTAIPLRASDLKLLQAELDKRKGNSATAQSTKPVPGAGKEKEKEKQLDAVFNGVEEGKKDRQGRTVAERIGI